MMSVPVPEGMDRREFLAATGVSLAVPLGGCTSSGLTASGSPDRPWTPSDFTESSDGVHHLFVENYTDTTEAAWLRVVREDGSALVDGRYELPDGRGIRFEDIAAWKTTYTIDLAIDGEGAISLEWYTEECGDDSEAPGGSGSRNAAVRVEAATAGTDVHDISLAVDECDALVAPRLPTGPATAFRLDE